MLFVALMLGTLSLTWAMLSARSHRRQCLDLARKKMTVAEQPRGIRTRAHPYAPIGGFIEYELIASIELWGFPVGATTRFFCDATGRLEC
jgi:hypothetical protein